MPSRSLSTVFIAIAALMVLVGVLLFWTRPDPAALPSARAQAPKIETFEIAATLIQPRAEIAGLLQARRRIELFAEENGRVLERGAEELQRVEAGQLLFRLDPLSAEVAVSRARAAIERAKSQSVLARADLTRNQGLAGRDVASRAALDGAENAARLAAAARLDAEALLVEAEDRLAKKTLEAPFAGVLRSFPVEPGEYVRSGELVGELLDVDRLRVTIGLTDHQVVAIRSGASAKLAVDALPGEVFAGEIMQVGAAIDRESRKFPIRIEVPNADGRLLPGMVARVDLTLGEPRSVLLVPRDAVVVQFGLRHVYLVEKTRPNSGEGENAALEAWVAHARRVEVRDVAFRPMQLEVAAGLNPGDRIAASSLHQLHDGMAVQPLAPRNPGAISQRATGQ